MALQLGCMFTATLKSDAIVGRWGHHARSPGILCATTQALKVYQLATIAKTLTLTLLSSRTFSMDAHSVVWIWTITETPAGHPSVCLGSSAAIFYYRVKNARIYSTNKKIRGPGVLYTMNHSCHRACHRAHGSKRPSAMFLASRSKRILLLLLYTPVHWVQSNGHS